MTAQNDDLVQEAIEAAAKLREAPAQVEELLRTAKLLGGDEGYDLVRQAYRISERVWEESEDLAILLFEPDPEECVA